MDDSRLARKVDETRAAIAALTRQAEGVHRQIEIQKIKLQAFLELAGEEDSEQQKDARTAPLFVSTIPWDKALAMLRPKIGSNVFGAEDVAKELAKLGIRANRKTVRWKLRTKAASGELIKVDDGQYKFPAAQQRAA